MPPVAYNKWMAYFDRLEQEYKNRCTTCQKILADVSEITIGAKERKTEEGKERKRKRLASCKTLKSTELLSANRFVLSMTLTQ